MPSPRADRRGELSASTVNILLLGWAKAPIPPLGEPGRWQLAFMSPDELRDTWMRHRVWLLEEARRRGIVRPWAAREFQEVE